VEIVVSFPVGSGTSLSRELPDVADLWRLSATTPLAMLAISKELIEDTSSPVDDWD